MRAPTEEIGADAHDVDEQKMGLLLVVLDDVPLPSHATRGMTWPVTIQAPRVSKTRPPVKPEEPHWVSELGCGFATMVLFPLCDTFGYIPSVS